MLFCQQDFHLYNFLSFWRCLVPRSSLCHFSVLKRNETSGLPLVFCCLNKGGKWTQNFVHFLFPINSKTLNASLEVIMFIIIIQCPQLSFVFENVAEK